MNYMGITKNSIADGTGVRVVLWVSGCTCKCEGCHNQEAWELDAGKEFNQDSMEELLGSLDHDYIKGLTLSGGHPLENASIPSVLDICKKVKTKFPNKDIWLYTGWVWEDIIQRKSIKDIFELCDVVVDGPFDINKRDTTIAFRGSTNQRLIDSKKSIIENKVILYEVKQ